jgi:hypothetical protein
MRKGAIDRIIHHSRAPRPYVAFAAANEKQALYLYRSQNLIWIWLGVASVLAAVSYFSRPTLGVVLVSSSVVLDISRELLFAIGGIMITAGVWTIRRAVEVLGHIFFATGATLNAIATITIPHITVGGHIVTAITLLGVAAASGFRAYFIVEWIGSDVYAPDIDE